MCVCVCVCVCARAPRVGMDEWVGGGGELRLYSLYTFVCFISLLLLLYAFYVRVDTLIFRDGMNKVFCIRLY